MSVIVIDFDGTITNHDVIDCIVSDAIGNDAMLELNNDLCNNKLSYPSYLRIVENIINRKSSLFGSLSCYLDYIKYSFDIHVDDQFEYLNSHYNLIVLSGGIDVIIQHFINSQYIVSHSFDNGIVTHNDTVDPKCNYINNIIIPKYENFIYIGDGISDVSVAEHCNPKLLFTKNGKYLQSFCQNHNISHLSFDSLRDVVCYLS